ncbi:hypothetical protein NECAME_03520 [Necator americanus]|uniref:glucuronosyltransferase n=1 Tax=Necator americanus TaxID=51031 RepID=W2T598_NECAM|nr:hypothetical protein NECAME_03520 [Necator americanus]ETN76147.1 hypothetical protein NECAME_03520 [Necator americanus]
MRPFSLLLLLLPVCDSLNILLFLLGTNQYERNIFEFLAQQLALRHHNVITVKPILIPEEPRLVKPKLHLVKEKTLKNMLPKNLYEDLEKAGDVIPWKAGYEEEAYDEVYWKAHNASCYKMINSNLLEVLQKDAPDVAITYSGNPCQLAIAHILAVPVIYYDLEGLSDETLVASNSPLNLDAPPSRCFLPEVHSLYALSRIRNGICCLREYLVQSGIPFVSKIISKKYRLLDDPITTMFAEDYNFQKRFKQFPATTTLLRSSSFFFANTDPLLEFPRALSPRVIPVGGLHIDHPKPLFAPWNISIESAKKGLIIVSLGTQANHAGMKASQVSAYSKSDPRYCYVFVSFRYSTRAKEMSKEFRSRSTSAFATALHYIEHVGRNHGSAFLGHTPLHPLATLNFDLFAVVLLFFYVLLFFTCRLFRLVFNCQRKAQIHKQSEPIKGRQAKKND